jgi:hypothetical protein
MNGLTVFLSRESVSMRCIFLIGMTAGLAACALAEKPDVWVRADGKSAVAPALSTAVAECQNEAVLAVAKFGRLLTANAYAQSNNPYLVVPAPTYPTAPMDFSSLSSIPDQYAAGAERRRREQMRDQIMRSTMEACMAHDGYLRSP